MRFGPALLLCCGISTLAFAASPRVTYERIITAPYSLGDAEQVVLVGAIGDTIGVEVFIEHLIEQTNRSGTLRLNDDRSHRHAFVLEHLRKAADADAYLVVRAFTCASEDKTGEGSRRDPDGKRIPHRDTWVETRCTAKIDALTAAGARLSFAIKGVGTSTRTERITADDREDALMHAARFAAIDATEKIAPRRVRETILLDETAPGVAEGYALISNGNLTAARDLWLQALRRRPGLASLHFNIAAVCEALGDAKNAEQNYAAAAGLAPKEKRYAVELRSFHRRTGAIRR